MTIKTVGELIQFLSQFPLDKPVVGTKEVILCDTCGPFSEERELLVSDLETRLVFEAD